MVNIRFQICALLIVVMLLVIFFSKKMLQSFSDKVYISLLGSIFVSVVLDMSATALVVEYSVYSEGMYLGMCKMYLASLVISVYLTFLFISIDAIGEKREVYRLVPISGLPAYFGICYICLLPLKYHIYEGSLFFDGAASRVAYGIYILYFILIGVLLQSKKSRMRKETRQSAKLVVALLVVIALKELLNANIRIESLAFALMAVFIYMNLKKADEHIDKSMEIFNREAFLYYLKDLVEDEKPAYILYIGFDELKSIIATFGSENGRQLFKSVVKSLATVNGGKVFRIDAYEVACVFTGSKSAYRRYRSTIRYRLREDYMILDAHVKLPTYVVEVLVPEKHFDYGEVISIMKQCMVDMVADGRAYTLVKDENFEELRKQNHIRRVIEQAIASGHIEMCYQPIFNAKENSFDSAEALLRMYDEDGNRIPSERVIAIAEQSGLILQLGSLIFKTVFSFFEDHDLLGRKIKKLHINLSGVQCASEGLVRELTELMSEHRIPPKYLDLEIREKADHLSDEAWMNNMNTIKSLGTTFSLDDYGRGYANLEALMEWPISHVNLYKDLVRIDKSNKKAEQALFFVLEMARQLGMAVVAKGVETEEDFERMQNHKVNYIQGYYLARVLNEKDFLDFLEKPLIIDTL